MTRARRPQENNAGVPLAPPVRTAKARRKLQSHSAFTLVEVILAMALTVVLLSALYGAISLYGRLMTSGRTDVERAQLARAILRKIERDLHSVVFRESEAVSIAATDDGTGTGETGTGTATDETVVDPTIAYTAAGGGIFGDASSLILHVNRPARDLNYALLGDGTGGRTSDLLSVSWFLASANSTGLQGAVGNLAAGGSALSSQATGIQGLARLEGDRLAVTMADQAGQLGDLAQATELLAEEVNYLQFSYFDGLSWWDTWDSVSMGGLPQAIEIVIGFGPPLDETTDPSLMTTATPADLAAGMEIQETYRLVVSLPIAAPYVPTTTGF